MPTVQNTRLTVMAIQLRSRVETYLYVCFDGITLHQCRAGHIAPEINDKFENVNHMEEQKKMDGMDVNSNLLVGI